MITSTPNLQSSDRVQNQTAQNIIQNLNQLLKNPLTQGNLLTGIALVSGANVIQHKLGRQIQGWVLVDVTSVITLYRSAPMNDATLTLTSSASSTVSLYVF